MDDVLLFCILKMMVQGFFSTKMVLVVSCPVPVIDGERASHLIYLDEEHFPTTNSGEAELIGWGPRSVLPAMRVLAHVWISVWGHRL